jgi:hypothetical protein
VRLLDLKDKHEGQVCFVLGAGPSLRHVDTRLLSKGVTIAVNSAILKYPESDYWISDDQDTRNWSYFADVVLPSRAIKLIDKKRLGAYVPERTDVIKYERQNWYDWFSFEKNRYYSDRASFTLSEPLLGTRTSAATAVHVAKIFGISRVLLLGCDCAYDRGLRYFWQFPGYVQPTRQGRDPCPNRLRHDIYRRVVSDAHCQEMLGFWTAFHHLLLVDGPLVGNGSGTGLIPFPRVSLEDFCDTIK